MAPRLLAAFLCPALVLASAPHAAATDREGRGTELRVLTFNVWHGLRSGESRKRFPGEDPARSAERFAWQIEEIQRLDPDLLLLQEVNPNQRQAGRYAAALGYDEIHKVTSCGLHLGALYKIPANVNEGLAILAKPRYRLRRSGRKRLSGNARCTASWGFQTRESRYALFAEITVDARKILVTTTHLSAPVFVLPDFDRRLEALVEDGKLTPAQHDEIQAERARQLSRNLEEVEVLLEQIDRRSARLGGQTGSAPIILGGDFNAEPASAGIEVVLDHGFLAAGTGPELRTWDPITNHVNYRIGTRRHEPLPTFGKAEVQALLAHRSTTPRQIDHLFVRGGLHVVSAEMVMNRERDGIYPSDHFALLATIELP